MPFAITKKMLKRKTTLLQFYVKYVFYCKVCIEYSYSIIEDKMQFERNTVRKTKYEDEEERKKGSRRLSERDTAKPAWECVVSFLYTH